MKKDTFERLVCLDGVRTPAQSIRGIQSILKLGGRTHAIAGVVLKPDPFDNKCVVTFKRLK